MHKSGHLGTSLLAYAPVMAVLIGLEYTATALVGLAVAASLSMLPDIDQRLPKLKHRGASHTFLAVGLVGVIATGLALAPVGLGLLFAVGVYTGIDRLVPGLRNRGKFITYGGAIVAGAGASVALQSAPVSSIFPFIIGAVAALSVGAHLIGDMLTPTGVRPLWPVKNTKYTIDVVKAANPVANYLLLVLGIIAVALAGMYGGQIPL